MAVVVDLTVQCHLVAVGYLVTVKIVVGGGDLRRRAKGPRSDLVGRWRKSGRPGTGAGKEAHWGCLKDGHVGVVGR